MLLGGKRHGLGFTFYEPTVIGDVNNEMRISRYKFEEVKFIDFCKLEYAMIILRVKNARI